MKLIYAINEPFAFPFPPLSPLPKFPQFFLGGMRVRVKFYLNAKVY